MDVLPHRDRGMKQEHPACSSLLQSSNGELAGGEGTTEPKAQWVWGKEPGALLPSLGFNHVPHFSSCSGTRAAAYGLGTKQAGSPAKLLAVASRDILTSEGLSRNASRSGARRQGDWTSKSALGLLPRMPELVP